MKNFLKKKIDYFFLNSYHLKKDNVKDDFKLKNLSKSLEPFSKLKKNMESNFFDLIDPKITYDFLMAIFFFQCLEKVLGIKILKF